MRRGLGKTRTSSMLSDAPILSSPPEKCRWFGGRAKDIGKMMKNKLELRGFVEGDWCEE
jgi:hypothetical protein